MKAWCKLPGMEIWIAVSEIIPGWGVVAKFEQATNNLTNDDLNADSYFKGDIRRDRTVSKNIFELLI